MHETYEYRTLSLERGAWPRVREAVATTYADRVREGAGTVFGLFSGEIGFWTNEAVLMTANAPTEEPVDGIELTTTEQLVATVRPVDPTPPDEPGVYAHRWFHVARTNWEEFLALSEAGWKPFEALYDCRIVGLFLSREAQPEVARALLVTRYSSVAEWERSRPMRAEPPPGADPELYEQARREFSRRARLTLESVVRLTRLAGAR